MIEVLIGNPALVHLGPGGLAQIAPLMAQQERLELLAGLQAQVDRIFAGTPEVALASWAGSGTQMALSSPARDSSASRAQSRRSVLMRSPGRRGTSEGAMTSQR
jgi:hypothetical protein